MTGRNMKHEMTAESSAGYGRGGKHGELFAVLRVRQVGFTQYQGSKPLARGDILAEGRGPDPAAAFDCRATFNVSPVG